jgi:hypothetical protein
MYEVLFTKRIDLFGYNKIISIKSLNWNWTEAERDASNFSIINLELADTQKREIENNNKWGINATYDGLIETPVEYQVID